MRKALICLAFATYCFLNTWVELAQGEASYFARYHPWYASVPPVVVLKLLLFAVLLSAWLFLERKGAQERGGVNLAFLALCLLPVGITSVALLRAIPFDLTPIVRQRRFWPVALAVLTPIAVAALRRPAGSASLIRSLILYSWPVLALILLEAARVSLLRYPASAFLDGPPAQSLETRPPVRVVWIVFDELSQAIAFERRPASLTLPHFDRLRSQGFYAVSARAPAPTTEQSIPALTLGETVTKFEPRGPDSVFVYTAARPAGFEWGSAPNIFDHARRLGVDSAVVGWYFPYCRLLNSSLTGCHWTAGGLLSGVEETLDPPSLAGAIRHRVRCQLAVFPLLGHLPGWAPRAYQRREALARFERLMDRARTLVADPSTGLVFIHLPVPHPPAVYSRKEKKFTDRGSNNYLDGLVLADWTLGQLRQSIEAAGLGEKTALIVSGDHGWRDLWRGGPDWTDEEETASQGIDTSGVPFLVKLPGADMAVTFSDPFDTVITGDLVLSILGGQLTTPSQLAKAVGRESAREP